MARKIAKYYGRQKLQLRNEKTFRAFGSNLEPSSVNDRNMQCLYRHQLSDSQVLLEL